MKDNKSLFQRVKLYAIPGLITCAVIVFIYVFKGIWPFGANRIDYFDNMQQVAPLYAPVSYTHLTLPTNSRV